MPADPTPKMASAARKRPAQSKRGAIACVRCKERKAKCTPAPVGVSALPTCTNCLTAKTECVYLDRTPNELFLLEYVSQLEARIAQLELELAKHTSSPNHPVTVDHSKIQAAAIESLTQQYPPGTWPVNGATVSVTPGVVLDIVSAPAEETSPSMVKSEPVEDQEDLAYGLGLLSLSGSGEPVYVGESSGVNWARVCATALRGPHSRAGQPSNLSKFNYLAPPETSSIESAVSYSQHHPIPPLPSPALCDRYLEAAYQHIQARYGFLDWPTVRNWHENREAICLNRPLWGVGRGKDHRRTIAAFTLWLLYGYGARLTEDEHLEGAVSHEVYHNIAVACLSNLTIHTSLATVQAELLLTIYSFRHPAPEISVWQSAGLALRLAIQIGLHRRARSKAVREKNPLAYEMKKRTFWTIYTIDRMLALQLGRPFGIQDRDIDVEMPINIDVDFSDAKEIFRIQNAQIKGMKVGHAGDEYATGYSKVTSMTSAIHNTRLNQIKQHIQDAIYRLDQPMEQRVGDRLFSTDSIPDVEDALARLSRWQATIPIMPPNRPGVPLLSVDLQNMEYHNCVQMLLRPIISSRLASVRYLLMCFDSAASLCEIQCAALAGAIRSVRLSNWALYRLFLSGLTLLHLASSPVTAVYIDLARARMALHRCQEALAIFTRHLPAMKGYLDVFAELVTGWEAKFVPAPLQQPTPPDGLSSTVPGPRPSSVQGTSTAQASTAAHSVHAKPVLSDPLKWLESLAAPNTDSSQPQQPVKLHIPLQPANQVQQPMSALSANPSDLTMLHQRQSGMPHSAPPHQMSFQNTPFTMYGEGSALPYLPQHQQQGGFAQTSGPFDFTGFNVGPVSSAQAAGAAGLWMGTDNPPLEQFGGAPGCGVRDDFQSLLSSLGVDMDESLGMSLPSMAEDQLWTSDWGVLPPSAAAFDQNQPYAGTGAGSISGTLPYHITGAGQLAAGSGSSENGLGTGMGNGWGIGATGDMEWTPDGEGPMGWEAGGIGDEDMWKFPFA